MTALVTQKMAAKLKLPAGVSRERSLTGFDTRCLALAWSPDGTRLAAGFDDGTIRVWHARAWAEPQSLRGHSERVYSLSWSPDGRRLASGSQDHAVRIWEAETGKSLHTLEGHANEVNSVALVTQRAPRRLGERRRNSQALGSVIRRRGGNSRSPRAVARCRVVTRRLASHFGIG